MNVVRIVDFESATVSPVTYRPREFGASGVVVKLDLARQGTVLFEQTYYGVFWKPLLQMEVKTAGYYGPGMFALPLLGRDLRVTFGASGVYHGCFAFVDEPVCWGTVCLKEADGTLGAGATGVVLNSVAVGVAVREVCWAFTGNKSLSGKLDVRPANLTAEGASGWVSVPYVAGGGGNTGWIPTAGTVSGSLRNDDAGASCSYASLLFGRLG